VLTDDAAGVYERCGWQRLGTAVEPGDVLTETLTA